MKKPLPYKGNYIGGKFKLPPGRAGKLVSEDPGDLAHPAGTIAFHASAVAAATEAAKKAFAAWSKTPFEERVWRVAAFGEEIKKRTDRIALVMSWETGKPLAESKVEVERIAAKCESAARYEPELLGAHEHEPAAGLTGRVRWKPRGVLAILAPFNVPAHLLSSQTISSILCGNTVVVKPSEIAPFTAQEIAEAWHATNLPAGVFNLVQGDGTVGKALVGDKNVAGVFFTGSWETGSAIQASLADSPEKICALEMGGKNAAIVLADCDIDEAVRETVSGAYMTTGQRCNATSRILVEKSISSKFIDKFVEKARQVKIGYATDPGVTMGPLSTKKGFERVISLLKKAPKEGFEPLLRGGVWEHPDKRGYYVRTSVHLRKTPVKGPVKDHSYADDEVFGPDAAIYVVKSLDEAIALNNRPNYGLAASVFTKSKENFERVVQGAECGVVNWNVATIRSSGRLPFGGLKRSGNHRPAGFFSPYFCATPTASVEKKPS